MSRKHGWPRYESLQPHYNLYERAAYETTLEPLALQEKLGVIPYYSLASGFLTGKYRSKEDLNKSVRGLRNVQYLEQVETYRRLWSVVTEQPVTGGLIPVRGK